MADIVGLISPLFGSVESVSAVLSQIKRACDHVEATVRTRLERVEAQVATLGSRLRRLNRDALSAEVLPPELLAPPALRATARRLSERLAVVELRLRAVHDCLTASNAPPLPSASASPLQTGAGTAPLVAQLDDITRHLFNANHAFDVALEALPLPENAASRAGRVAVGAATQSRASRRRWNTVRSAVHVTARLKNLRDQQMQQQQQQQHQQYQHQQHSGVVQQPQREAGVSSDAPSLSVQAVTNAAPVNTHRPPAVMASSALSQQLQQMGGSQQQEGEAVRLSDAPWLSVQGLANATPVPVNTNPPSASALGASDAQQHQRQQQRQQASSHQDIPFLEEAVTMEGYVQTPSSNSSQNVPSGPFSAMLAIPQHQPTLTNGGRTLSEEIGLPRRTQPPSTAPQYQPLSPSGNVLHTDGAKQQMQSQAEMADVSPERQTSPLLSAPHPSPAVTIELGDGDQAESTSASQHSGGVGKSSAEVSPERSLWPSPMLQGPHGSQSMGAGNTTMNATVSGPAVQQMFLPPQAPSAFMGLMPLGGSPGRSIHLIQSPMQTPGDDTEAATPGKDIPQFNLPPASHPGDQGQVAFGGQGQGQQLLPALQSTASGAAAPRPARLTGQGLNLAQLQLDMQEVEQQEQQESHYYDMRSPSTIRSLEAPELAPNGEAPDVVAAAEHINRLLHWTRAYPGRRTVVLVAGSAAEHKRQQVAIRLVTSERGALRHRRFTDGIHRLHMGIVGNSKTPYKADQRVVRLLGSLVFERPNMHDVARQMKNCGLASAVETTKHVFTGRAFLLVLYDVRKAPGRRDGYLSIMKSVISEAPEACLLVTTMDQDLVGKRGI